VDTIHLIDTTLRDGQHAISEQFTAQQAADIAGALDKTGIFGVEFGHGAGLGGNGDEYGYAAASDVAYIQAVKEVAHSIKIIGLFIPGLGKLQDLADGLAAGLDVIRIAVNAGDAKQAEIALKMVRESNRMPIGFMMMSSTKNAAELAKEAQVLAASGAEIVYITDSAGAMLPKAVQQAVMAIKETCPEIAVGFHGHNNLGLAITNSLTAIDAGATYIDGTLRGMGAGAGNAPLELLAVLLAKIYGQENVNVQEVLKIAETCVEPILPVPTNLSTEWIMLGADGIIGNAAYVAKKET
jgi:4-hydroxy 2-oxovalerate aldolase